MKMGVNCAFSLSHLEQFPVIGQAGRWAGLVNIVLLAMLLAIAGSVRLAADVDVLFSEDFEDESTGAVSKTAIPWTPSGSASPDWVNSLTGPTGNVSTFSIDNTTIYGNATNKVKFKLSTAGTPVLFGATFNATTQQYVTVEYDLHLDSTPSNNPAGEVYYADTTDTLTSTTPKIAVHFQFSDKSTVTDDASGANNVFYRTTGQDGNTATDEGNEYQLFSGATWNTTSWYRVQVIANQTAKTFDIKVTNLTTGTVVGTNTGLTYNDTSAGNIRAIWFALTASAPTMYLDNIQIYQDSTAPAVSAPTITVNTENAGSVKTNPSLDVDFYDDVDLAIQTAHPEPGLA